MGLKKEMSVCGDAIKWHSAYTLAEVVIVMLVVAVIVGVSIKITKAKLDNIVSYTYYSGYSTLKDVTKQVLNDFKPTDKTYMDKEAWVSPKALLALILPMQKAKAEDLKYICAHEEHDGPPRSYSVSDYGAATSPELLGNCEHSVSRWYSFKGKGIYYMQGGTPVSDVESVMVKCPGKVKLPNNILKYWDANTASLADTYSLRYIKGSTVLAEAECNNPCGDGNNNCGTSHVSFSQRFSCPFGEFLDSGENLYKKWPICVYEPYTPSTPTGCTTTPTNEEKDTLRCQEQKEWQGYPTCGWHKITCTEGNHWSVNSCGCVPEPPTIPRKGQNFCEKFVSYANTKSNSAECSGDAIPTDLIDFSDKTADITLRNGMRIYNIRQNPAPIQVLDNNIQGASYDGVDNVNEYGYTVYLDIDGEKGPSTLWQDVYPFYITMSGTVIPAYNMTVGSEETGGNSRHHLMTSIEKESVDATGHRKLYWISKSVSYKEGACSAGYIGASTAYCHGVPLKASCSGTDGTCILKYVSPVKFFQ